MQLKKSHAIDDEAKKSLDRLKNQKDEAKKEVIKTREEAERCRMRWQEEKEKVAFLEEKVNLMNWLFDFFTQTYSFELFAKYLDVQLPLGRLVSHNITKKTSWP